MLVGPWGAPGEVEQLTWLQSRGYGLSEDLLETARVAMQVNLAKERRRVSRSVSRGLTALVG